MATTTGEATTGNLDGLSVTKALMNWRAGEPAALDTLSRLVYEELRRLARRYMVAERSNHTLQPTALVNEAFIRMVDMEIPWKDRVHFFSVAACTMRRILVDYAKAHRSKKRGGPDTTLSLEETRYVPPSDDPDMLDLDDALRQLARHDEAKATLVELHYFGGLKYDEMAEVLGISQATVHRHLSLAKAYLQAELTR